MTVLFRQIPQKLGWVIVTDQGFAGKINFVTGANQKDRHLKNVNLDLPRNQLIVITGLSGSGKSSLAFDTIYAEGQRRYLESMSSYARQFLDRMKKPDVDRISGLSPSIAIEQKSVLHNPRSTVATVMEIYDYLRLLYAKLGDVHCHQCSSPVRRQSTQEIFEQIDSIPSGSQLGIFAPVVRGRKGEFGPSTVYI